VRYTLGGAAQSGTAPQRTSWSIGCSQQRGMVLRV